MYRFNFHIRSFSSSFNLGIGSINARYVTSVHAGDLNIFWDWWRDNRWLQFKIQKIQEFLTRRRRCGELAKSLDALLFLILIYNSFYLIIFNAFHMLVYLYTSYPTRFRLWKFLKGDIISSGIKSSLCQFPSLQLSLCKKNRCSVLTSNKQRNKLSILSEDELLFIILLKTPKLHLQLINYLNLIKNIF